MNYLNGGYVMLDKADSDIFAKASGALQAGKPILWYEDKNTCYFIDTIEKTGSDSIALTKGGLTIVITSGNVVTELGTVQQHLYSHNIVFQLTIEDDSVTDLYATLQINNTSASMTDEDVEDYIKSFNWGEDEACGINAFGTSTYVGIAYSNNKYIALTGVDDKEITTLTVYSTTTKQIF